MRLVRWAMTVMVVAGLVIAASAAQDPATGGRGAQRGGGAPPGGQRGGGGGPAMTLTTSAFADGGQIPAKYTQAGAQVSPALTWNNVPPNTAGFVLHMHDMEGVRNRTTDDQLHWLRWALSGTATGRPEGLPPGGELAGGRW